MPLPTGNGEITNFTDSEQLMAPKTDCALKVYKDKEFYYLGFIGLPQYIVCRYVVT